VGAWAKQGALAEVHPGWPTAEWTLPLFLDAVAKGRCTLRQVARWTSSLPAKRMGLGRKGRLEEGFDADLVLVDPTLRAEVGVDARVHTVAGWSPWQGQVLQGWPVRTLVAGHTVYTHTEGIIERGRGRELS
jgi:dihydroorotase